MGVNSSGINDNTFKTLETLTKKQYMRMITMESIWTKLNFHPQFASLSALLGGILGLEFPNVSFQVRR